MRFNFLVRNSSIEKIWSEALDIQLKALGDSVDFSRLYLIDSNKLDWRSEVSHLNRGQVSFVLVLEEGVIPDPKVLNEVDDILVFPFRLPEVLSVLKHHQMRLDQLDLAAEINTAQADLQNVNGILERILKAKTPKRYSQIQGIQVMSKHLAGLKPGGDYFDVFESDRKDFVNLLLVDSSSYGISAAFLGMILSSSARMANDAQLSTADWVKAIYQELKVTLGDNGNFSVFFGRINKRTFTLHYQLYGSIEAFIVGKDGQCQPLLKQGQKITARSEPETQVERQMSLNPRDRLVLLSDGFVGGVGGDYYLRKIFNERLDQDPFDLVNELSFQIKSKLSPGETFPGEDCSAIVIDIDQRVLRLAPAS